MKLLEFFYKYFDLGLTSWGFIFKIDSLSEGYGWKKLEFLIWTSAAAKFLISLDFIVESWVLQAFDVLTIES